MKMHQSTRHIEAHNVACLVQHDECCHDRVGPTAETRQHLPGVVNISGLPEDLLLQDNDRIGAEHDRCGPLLGDMPGFGICYPPGIGPGPFTRADAFIDIGWDHRERYGQLCEQGSTPWRS
jgi:hypothetical protein